MVKLNFQLFSADVVVVVVALFNIFFRNIFLDILINKKTFKRLEFIGNGNLMRHYKCLYCLLLINLMHHW